MKKEKQGILVISLDFELFWGIRDKYSFEEYGPNVLGVWEVIPKLLELFKKHDLHATFATVGAMFSSDLEDLKQYLPKVRPAYEDQNLSPYLGYIDESIQHNDQYYFGKKLLELVKKDSNHEIGTHTFSHYYALELGQSQKEFEADLDAAIEIAKANEIKLETLIFPRHQINVEYLNSLSKKSIKIYRETEKAWFHSAARGAEESIVKRGFRYLDYFVNLGHQHCQDLSEIKQGELYAIRASRWLRPFKESESRFDQLKIQRIKSQMKYAAQNGKIFHLWFHPHDIGIHQEENFQMLAEIFAYYEKMKKDYQMESRNMKEVVELYKQKYGN